LGATIYTGYNAFSKLISGLGMGVSVIALGKTCDKYESGHEDDWKDGVIWCSRSICFHAIFQEAGEPIADFS
jgi:hypothetical protein